MKRTLSILIATVLITGFAYAQNTAGKANDAARIALHSVVPESVEGMPDAAKTFLKTKLDQIATQNGAGGNSITPRFIITAKVSVVSKDITATAPPMTALSLDVTFFVGDAVTMTQYATANVQVKGVGTNETKAYIEGIKTIKANNPDFKTLVDAGKKKIMEYYNSQCDFILKKAETLANQKRYDEAMFELSQIPDVCKECYDKAMTAIGPIYLKYRDVACSAKLNDAKAAWAGAQNSTGAAKVAEILKGIDPEAACMPDVNTFVAEVKAKVIELEKRDWDFNMKAFDAGVDLEKRRIDAAREVGVAYGNGQPETVYKVDQWVK
jgi:hypothetical protein